MSFLSKYQALSSEHGFAPILIIIILFIGLLIGFDLAYIWYLEECGDVPLMECLTEEPEEEAAQAEAVVATGSFSYKDYGVNISVNVPLAGGAITGSFEGDCSGKITGTYDGQEGGVISGKAFGSCSPLVIPLPATANFSGTVQKVTKTIPISGSGSAAGISGDGSLTLSFE